MFGSNTQTHEGVVGWLHLLPLHLVSIWLLNHYDGFLKFQPMSFDKHTSVEVREENGLDLSLSHYPTVTCKETKENLQWVQGMKSWGNREISSTRAFWTKLTEVLDFWRWLSCRVFTSGAWSHRFCSDSCHVSLVVHKRRVRMLSSFFRLLSLSSYRQFFHHSFIWA
jgi:hypothetical protein